MMKGIATAVCALPRNDSTHCTMPCSSGFYSHSAYERTCARIVCGDSPQVTPDLGRSSTVRGYFEFLVSNIFVYLTFVRFRIQAV